MSDVRVRFAPSPTGHLHIGGARTALFNWLYARNNDGRFILRIEDTDTTRSTDEYIESIMDGMRWLKLTWDEGPFRQTERFDVYKSYIEKLLADGKAYRCYCTQEELEARREEAQKEGKTYTYDRRCRDLKEAPAGAPPASVRFKMPVDGTVTVMDMIKGGVTFENAQMDDLIIARSDGTPTYNFVVVVDDVDMKISHVIRGDDHLNNTPKQLHIYRALGYKEPVFAHLPMILGSDKTRLSKRHGATSVIAYRDEGYLADALVNYLVRLGWSSGDQEVFTRDELVKLFSFESVGKAASVFNPEKLLWLNAEYIKVTPKEELADLVMPFLVKDGTIRDVASVDMAWLAKAIATLVERSKTLVELASQLKYYIAESVEFDEAAKKKFLTAETKPYLTDIRAGIEDLSDLTHDTLEKLFGTVTEKHNVKLGKVAQPVRVAMTGNTQSPGIFELIEVMGKQKAMSRLDNALGVIEG